MADFLGRQEKTLAIYADLFQVDSVHDVALRSEAAFEQALSQRAKVKTFLKGLQNYLKHFRVEVSMDPLSGAPAVTFAGSHIRDEKSLGEIFSGIRSFSQDYHTLLILDEFQDVTKIHSLEAKLRSEIQSLDRTAVILLGSKRHILREMFQDESRPFYGFGVDVEFKKIPRPVWLPYMKERFAPAKLTIGENAAFEICGLMGDVPNAVQELCQWIALSGQTGPVTVQSVHEDLAELIANKSSRYLERLASLSAKEKKVLIAVARQGPVSSVASTKFLQATQVSATATRATVLRLMDQGVLDQSEEGYRVTDPIVSLFLARQSEKTQDKISLFQHLPNPPNRSRQDGQGDEGRQDF